MLEVDEIRLGDRYFYSHVLEFDFLHKTKILSSNGDHNDAFEGAFYQQNNTRQRRRSGMQSYAKRKKIQKKKMRRK